MFRKTLMMFGVILAVSVAGCGAGPRRRLRPAHRRKKAPRSPGAARDSSHGWTIRARCRGPVMCLRWWRSSGTSSSGKIASWPATLSCAAPQQRLEIGSETNAQDNIIVRSLDDSSTIGDRTSLAHHAIIRDSQIGDFAFVGFNAEVVDSTVEDGAFILHGARVEGVTIPENSLVGVGEEVTTQEQADALPEAPAATEEFRQGVLDVNAEFAESYIELYESEGYEAVIEVGTNPGTSFAEQTEPQVGDGAELQEFVRVVGDVQIGPNAQVGQRTAIRADEGSPIIIGANADLDDRVTFHALEETDIEAGDELTAEDDVVFHGPLRMGNGISVGDRSVVFRVIVEDNVQIGERVMIAGPAVEEGEELSFTIPEGTVIPDGAIITDEESLQEVLNQQ